MQQWCDLGLALHHDGSQIGKVSLIKEDVGVQVAVADGPKMTSGSSRSHPISWMRLATLGMASRVAVPSQE